MLRFNLVQNYDGVTESSETDFLDKIHAFQNGQQADYTDWYLLNHGKGYNIYLVVDANLERVATGITSNDRNRKVTIYLAVETPRLDNQTMLWIFNHANFNHFSENNLRQLVDNHKKVTVQQVRKLMGGIEVDLNRGDMKIDTMTQYLDYLGFDTDDLTTTINNLVEEYL